MLFKDKVPWATMGVYEVPCSCRSFYAEETKLLVSTRLIEQQIGTSK